MVRIPREIKIILTILAVLIAFLGVMVAIQSNQASIDYWLENPATLENGLNHITLYCKNGGGMDGDFFLVVSFTNITFSNQTELPYIQVDNSTVKFKFVLHKGDSNDKTFYFIANNATTIFSTKVSLEKADFFQFLKANPIFPTELSYQWNEENECFDCKSSQ